MEHKWLRNYDSDGKWTKPERVIRVDGVEYDLDDYAKKHGIDLPDAKKPKHKKEVNSYADMGKTFHKGHSKVDGDGDSQGEE